MVAPNHTFCTRPWEWPLLDMHWDTYYSNGDKKVLAAAQPFAWTLQFFIALVASVTMILKGCNKSLDKKDVPICFLCIGYYSSYLPFFLVPRSMFFYHYIIPAIFADILSAAFIESILPKKWSTFAVTVTMGMALYGFVVWSPLCYGTYVPYNSNRVWFRRWNPV